MKFYITGSTRGLGEYLCNEFKCISIDRPFDISTDISKIVDQIEPDSIVILNAHADGTQIKYIEKLKDRCRLVIMGSIASVNQDPSMPEYSKQKKKLEELVTQLALDSEYPMLYLRLTSSSYKNYNMIAESIKFWLNNPDVTFIGYNINE